MEKIVTILVITTACKPVRGKAIHNAINIRLNSGFLKEDNTNAPELPGVFDSKIPLEVQEFPDYKQGFHFKSVLPKMPKIGGSNRWMNQIETLFPEKPDERTDASESHNQYLKIPIMSHPFSDYKIIVATAPWNVKITGKEAKPVVIYFVFPTENEEPINMNIPEIFFVKKGNSMKDLNKKDKMDPMIIVDSNRTVTGLKSNTVSKFIKFKNKINH